jgi:predicted DsbA family dithiol-disulfide isomerase
VYTAAYLANAATRAGVPAARAKALLAGDEYANAVRADEKAAREAGVTAVPFTILGGRLAIPGRRDSQCPPIPSPGGAPVTGEVLPGMEKTPSA